MRVLVVSEKPSLTDLLIEAIRRHDPWPGAEIDFVHSMMTGWWAFDWPRRYRFADLPMVLEPRFRLASGFVANDWRRRVLRVSANRSVVAKDVLFDGMGAKEMAEAARAFPRGYDLVVNFTDWYRGDVSFFRIVSGGAATPEEAALPPCPLIEVKPNSCRAEILDAVMRQLTSSTLDPTGGLTRPWRPDGAGLTIGLAKDRFDYNWMLNSMPLTGRLLAAVGADAPVKTSSFDHLPPRPASELFGRNALMLTGFVARRPMYEGEDGVYGLWKEHTLIKAMEEWRGTGKYKVAEHGWTLESPVGFGSVASRGETIGNLLKIGILEHPRRAEGPFRLADGMEAVCAETGGAGKRLRVLLEDCLSSERKATIGEIRCLLCDEIGMFRMDGDTPRLVPQFRDAIRRHLPGSGRGKWYMEPDDLMEARAEILGPVRGHDSDEYRWEIGVVLRLLNMLEGGNTSDLRLTETGRRLAALFPKEAFDPDLPFRLSEWCVAGASSYPRMDAYIRRLFKAMKTAADNVEFAELPASWFREARRRRGWSLAEAARVAQVPLELAEAVETGEHVGGPSRAAMARALSGTARR
jgi:hypothetical protein